MSQGAKKTRRAAEFHGLYLLILVDDVPNLLKVPDIRIGEEGVFFTWIEQGEIFHNDGDKQIQDNVGDDEVEWTEIDNSPEVVAAIRLPIVQPLVPVAEWRGTLEIFGFLKLNYGREREFEV